MAILHTVQPHPPVSFRIDEERLLELHRSLVKFEAANLSCAGLSSEARRDDHVLETLGAEAFELLFPESIRSALRAAKPTTPYVRIDVASP